MPNNISIVVKCCKECPFRRDSDQYLYDWCEHPSAMLDTNRGFSIAKLDDLDDFPEWCPLGEVLIKK